MHLPLALLALAAAPAPAALPVAPRAAEAPPNAEAVFNSLEPRFAAYRALKVGNPNTWSADFAAKSRALEALKLSYFEVIDRDVPRWTVASLVRVGELSWALADDVTDKGAVAEGTFDLKFGGQSVVGTFHATPCTTLAGGCGALYGGPALWPLLALAACWRQRRRSP